MRATRTITEQKMMEEIAKMNTIIGVLAIISFISIFAILIKISAHVSQKGLDACVDKGYSRQYCLYTK